MVKNLPANAGEPGSIPRSGKSTGEGIGYPLQYSWASLVAQLVKSLPSMRKTWVGKICWRRERLPTPVFWPGEFHGLCSPWGHKESDTTERISLSLFTARLKMFWYHFLTLVKMKKKARKDEKEGKKGERRK